MRHAASSITTPTRLSSGLRRMSAPLVAGVATASLALATAIVAVLEGTAVGIDDASPVYLIAVVAVGAAAGTWPAVATAIAAFLAYDLLFTEPRLSLTVADPREWLDLVLFLFVALAIGRLVAVQHARADEAAARAAEAGSLFAVSRSLATAASTEDAAPELLARLVSDARLVRAWINDGPIGRDRLLADSSSEGPSPPSPTIVTSLVRTPGDSPARWVRTHGVSTRAGGAPAKSHTDQYRVRIEVDGTELGSLGATRDRGLGVPTREETQILALAADQIAISLRRDQLRRTSIDLEISRQAEALKTALIDSVSHDLRTPLASIRATAGSLADPAVGWTDEARREAAALIDREAARLDRLVRGVLDLSRIASGAVHPDLEPHALWAVVEPVVERLRPAFGERPVRVDIPDTIPPVLADAVLLDIVVTNLVENAVVHAGSAAAVEITAVDAGHDTVQLVVADGGPGVPTAALLTLFDRFRRVSHQKDGSRHGLGIGLSVVKGLVESMGGTATATHGALGGLAVTITLRAAPAGPDA